MLLKSTSTHGKLAYMQIYVERCGFAQCNTGWFASEKDLLEGHGLVYKA